MSNLKGSREPVDRQTSVRLTFYPWTSHTVAQVDLGWRDHDGAHRAPLAYWHLDVTRADLAGRKTDDVIRLFVDGLLRHLDGADDPADQVAHRTEPSGVAASAPLEGPQGEAPTQAALPGL